MLTGKEPLTFVNSKAPDDSLEEILMIMRGESIIVLNPWEGNTKPMIVEENNKYISNLWQEYEPYVRMLCTCRLKSLPDYVDDCVQDVFLALSDALSKGNTIQYPKAWLTRVVNNKINDVYTRAKKERERYVPIYDVNFENDEANAVYDDYFVPKEGDIVVLNDKVLSMLSENERRLLDDRYKLKKSTSVIAKEHGTTVNNVYQMIFRLKQKVEMLVEKVLNEHRFL